MYDLVLYYGMLAIFAMVGLAGFGSIMVVCGLVIKKVITVIFGGSE